MEPKIGKVRYAFCRYKNLCSNTILTNEDYYLLLLFDSVSRDFDDFVTTKIIPMIENEKLRFVVTSD
ncbi:MAG: hypothetical protein WB587_12790 [Nitrososphaeraceae archaeon]